jgi:hypothetical protein
MSPQVAPFCFCQRLRPVAVAGRKKLVPCGRPRCSVECRQKWARKMSACVRRSALELAPTHEARVTATGYASDEELTAAHRRLFRKLKNKGCEYLAVNEWGESCQRHLHIILRTDAGVTAEQIQVWWEDSLPTGAKGTSHCAPIHDVTAFVRYAFKDMKEGGKLPPEDFPGKLYTASRGFLVRPLAALWKEERDEWDRSKATKEPVETPRNFGAIRFSQQSVGRTKTADVDVAGRGPIEAGQNWAIDKRVTVKEAASNRKSPFRVSPTLAHVAFPAVGRTVFQRHVTPPCGAAWAIRWAAAVTPRYPLHVACAAGPCIYNLAFDRHPLLADALDNAVYIDAGIPAHYPKLGEHELRM